MRASKCWMSLQFIYDKFVIIIQVKKQYYEHLGNKVKPKSSCSEHFRRKCFSPSTHFISKCTQSALHSSGGSEVLNCQSRWPMVVHGRETGLFNVILGAEYLIVYKAQCEYKLILCSKVYQQSLVIQKPTVRRQV